MEEDQHKYIVSERFIHDGLLDVAQKVVDKACELWESQKLTAHAMTWPSSVVKGDDGILLDRAIIMQMPKREEWKKALVALVDRTQAYGLLLLEPKEKEISVKFESPHGSRTWSIPIERHGDRNCLGDQRVKDDVECIGLLWSPSQGTA